MPVIVRRPPAELSSGTDGTSRDDRADADGALYEHLSDHAVNIAGQVIYIADIGPSVVRR
jgi:hypothetical protein